MTGHYFSHLMDKIRTCVKLDGISWKIAVFLRWRETFGGWRWNVSVTFNVECAWLLITFADTNTI